MKTKYRFIQAVAFGALLFGSAPADAGNFSFTGNFADDDDVLLFNFSVGAASTVTLHTLSYAGGVNAAGATIARGGFDPILSLFDSTGAWIANNDDGGPAWVPADPLTGHYYDTGFESILGVGTYTVAITQYNNWATGNYSGGNLSQGFDRTGDPFFTALMGTCSNGQFCDVTGVAPYNNRDNHWAFDILNVGQAVLLPPVSAVPLPAALPLFLSGLVGLGFLGRKRRQQGA